MPKYATLRFEKHKGTPAALLEAHHERQKEKYASNPDIDTDRSKYNFHSVEPQGKYYHFIKKCIEEDGCRTRKDSTRFVDTLVTASLEFFKGKSTKEIREFFQRAGEGGKMKDSLERKKLESELHDMKRIMSRIPPEVLDALKQDARQQTRD